MTEDEFMKVVEEAIDTLPDEFKNHIKNVEIVIADHPDNFQTSKMKQKYKTDRRFTLLGLYEGVPLKHRSVFATPGLPDRITLFRKSIEEFCSTHEEMVDQIQRTFLHEIGHYFGLSDKRLRELGF